MDRTIQRQELRNVVDNAGGSSTKTKALVRQAVQSLATNNDTPLSSCKLVKGRICPPPSTFPLQVLSVQRDFLVSFVPPFFYAHIILRTSPSGDQDTTKTNQLPNLIIRKSLTVDVRCHILLKSHLHEQLSPLSSLVLECFQLQVLAISGVRSHGSNETSKALPMEVRSKSKV